MMSMIQLREEPEVNSYGLTGFKLDEGNKEVNYSENTIMIGTTTENKDYIPISSVKTKSVESKDFERLRELKDKYNWAKRPVADPSQVISKTSESGFTTRYFLDGFKDMYTAHKNGPGGTGAHLNNQWKEISDIILGSD